MLGMLFLRSSPAVIAPNLRSELGLSVTELSGMPAALFLGSALMQLPVGVLLDRFGPRQTISGFLLITSIGILGVSYSYSAIGLIVTLFITGCGIAPVYMGLIVILSRWVPRDRLAAALAAHHRTPLVLHWGTNPAVRFFGITIPRRLQPSPLVLVVYSFTDNGVPRFDSRSLSITEFEFLDFDAY